MTEVDKDKVTEEAQARLEKLQAKDSGEASRRLTVPKSVRDEQHVLSDIKAGSQNLLGCQSEAVAGAAHLMGWEMTDEKSLAEVKIAVKTFLDAPA